MFVSDFFLSTEFIPRRRLNKWIQREGFHVRKLLILKWIFLGNVITLAYKSTLLSSLIKIRYESTIDTLCDLDKSALPALIPAGTPATQAFATDPREIMKSIFNRSIIYPFNGRIPPEFDLM